MWDTKKTFIYENRIIFDDKLNWFEELILKNDNIYYNVYFDFLNEKYSLSNVKNIILKNKNNINFDFLYFYNANDFINFVLDKEIYLPYNINLFISETCPIWCIYCENPNDIHYYLSIKEIRYFLSKYNIWDNMNFNILWQGDPIFNPELLDILSYIKSIWWHITFFSWGKSLLFVKDFDLFSQTIDEFKINISASNYFIYNKTHKIPINKKDFDFLYFLFEKIANKSTFLTILVKENISDLTEFIKKIVSFKAYWIEIKKNLQYPKNDILDNKIILLKVEKILNILKKCRNINIVSNIWTWFSRFHNLKFFHEKKKTLLDKIIEKDIYWKNLSLKEINNLWKCFQFGNSIDITENWKIALCCNYDISVISSSSYKKKYYDDLKFIHKKHKFQNTTPRSCQKCPMPIDRYKSYLKYNFVKNL